MNHHPHTFLEKFTTFTLNEMKIINTKHTNKKEENIKILRDKRKGKGGAKLNVKSD